MKRYFIFLLFAAAPLWALRVDPNCRGFETNRKREYIEAFDFGGLYPQLEKINIDGHRKKRVDVDLSGEYPLLRSFIFDGSFGRLDCAMTGSFPMLEDIDVKVTSNKVTLDLRGQWSRDCQVIVTGTKADVTLYLPKEMKLEVKTKTSARGKASSETLKKKGLFSKKRFLGGDPEAELTMSVYCEVTDGTIRLL